MVIRVEADTLARIAPSGIIGAVSKEDIAILDRIYDISNWVMAVLN
jgi:hypothetical protein